MDEGEYDSRDKGRSNVGRAQAMHAMEQLCKARWCLKMWNLMKQKTRYQGVQSEILYRKLPAPRPTKWLVDQNYDAESHTSVNTLEHPDPRP
jgi:hypothetical protein